MLSEFDPPVLELVRIAVYTSCSRASPARTSEIPAPSITVPSMSTFVAAPTGGCMSLWS